MRIFSLKRAKQAVKPIRSFRWLQWSSLLVLQLLVSRMATGAQEEPIFELQDQFGQVHSVVEVAKAPTILIGSDRAGRRLSREWALAVAELLSTSILLDWEGQVVGHYGFQPNLAKVLLLDRTGSIVIRVASGELQEAEIELLRQALLGLEAPSAPRTSSWNQPILLGSFL